MRSRGQRRRLSGSTPYDMNLAMIRPNPCGRLLLPAALLGLALPGCAEPPRRPVEPAAGAQASGAAPLERALDHALQRQTWTDLRIDAECRREDELRSAVVFGSGVGIWNRERQLVLPREKVVSLLRDFKAAGFPRLHETYGEGEEEVQLVCRVRLALDGLARQVIQLATGPQSPELARLAGRILEMAEEAGRSGTEASSLTDGLEKIARGELSPELLAIHVLRQSEPPGAETGWNLSLEGGELSVRRFPSPANEGPRRSRLPAAELAELAGRLAAARLEELPVNLWAPEYTDLEIRVLGRGRALQARQFAGMTPATHGELQQRFDRLWETLQALRGRLDAGRPSS